MSFKLARATSVQFLHWMSKQKIPTAKLPFSVFINNVAIHWTSSHLKVHQHAQLSSLDQICESRVTITSILQLHHCRSYGSSHPLQWLQFVFCDAAFIRSVVTGKSNSDPTTDTTFAQELSSRTFFNLRKVRNGKTYGFNEVGGWLSCGYPLTPQTLNQHDTDYSDLITFWYAEPQIQAPHSYCIL